MIDPALPEIAVTAPAKLHHTVGRGPDLPSREAPPMSGRYAPVAQLDRASDYESEGRTFESFRARHSLQALTQDLRATVRRT